MVKNLSISTVQIWNTYDTVKLKNKQFEMEWLYNDIKWRCIPSDDNDCDTLEVDRDGKYRQCFEKSALLQGKIVVHSNTRAIA